MYIAYCTGGLRSPYDIADALEQPIVVRHVVNCTVGIKLLYYMSW
jgi:hypothetical protein